MALAATEAFVISFIAILVIASLVNIFSSHLLAIINNVSVWWHVFGAAAETAGEGEGEGGRGKIEE